MTADEKAKIIIEKGFLSPEELAGLSKPDKITYLALMAHALDQMGEANFAEMKEALREYYYQTVNLGGSPITE